MDDESAAGYAAAISLIDDISMRITLTNLLVVIATVLPLAVPANDTPVIAAAADLKFALSEIASDYTRTSGKAVSITYGSSGTFTTQIENGAPFELFLSADESFVFGLADKKLTVDRGTLYAVGRLTLFAPQGSKLVVDGKLDGLKAALANGAIQHFSIANPEHAPYGRAARAVLQSLALWSAIEPTLVLGENAAQAMQFAASGATDGGIVPLSLASAPAFKHAGTYALIPAELHRSEPLHQRMVLLTHAGDVARDFYRFLQRPATRVVLSRFGFSLPSDGAP